MAEQTIQLLAGWYNGSAGVGDLRRWEAPSGSRPVIIDGLTPANASRTLIYCGVFSDGRVQLLLGTGQSDFTGNSDLTDAFEASGHLRITTATLTLTVALAGADTAEPYVWTPTNSAEVIAFYNALGTSAGAATLVIRDSAFAQTASITFQSGASTVQANGTEFTTVSTSITFESAAPTIEAVTAQTVAATIATGSPTVQASGQIMAIVEVSFESGTPTVQVTGTSDVAASITYMSGAPVILVGRFEFGYTFSQTAEEREEELLRVRAILVRMLSLNQKAESVYNRVKAGGFATENQARKAAQSLLDLCGPPGWRNAFADHDLDFSADGVIDVSATDWVLSSIVMNALLGIPATDNRPNIGWQVAR